MSVDQLQNKIKSVKDYSDYSATDCVTDWSHNILKLSVMTALYVSGPTKKTCFVRCIDLSFTVYTCSF
jgi:hypothetical protein